MGYRYIGTEPLWYVKDGMANIIFPGDWVPSEDVTFMVDNHNIQLDTVPNEGPTAIPDGYGLIGPTGPTGPTSSNGLSYGNTTTYYLSTSVIVDIYSEGSQDYSVVKTPQNSFASETYIVESGSDETQNELDDFYTLPGDLEAQVIQPGIWTFSVTSRDDTEDPNYLIGDSDFWGFAVYLLVPGEGYDWQLQFTTMCPDKIITGSHTYTWSWGAEGIEVPLGAILCFELLLTTSDDHDDRRYFVECSGWNATKITIPIPFKPYGGPKAGDILVGDSMAKTCVGTQLIADPESSSWGVYLYPATSNLIGLFNGREWVVASYCSNWFSGDSLDLDGNPVIANAVYDVFASLKFGQTNDYNLVGKKWSTSTSRGYSLSDDDGVLIGSDYWEDKNKRYVGTVYTYQDGSYVKFCNTKEKSYIYNHYNQRNKVMLTRMAGIQAVSSTTPVPWTGWDTYGLSLLSPGLSWSQSVFKVEMTFSYVLPNGDPLGRATVRIGEQFVSSPYGWLGSNFQNPAVAGDCNYQQSFTEVYELTEGLHQPVPLVYVDTNSSGPIGFSEMVIRFKG